MATISLTNRKASQSLRGQSVKVTLNAADSANLSSLQVGMRCQAGSFVTLGYIGSVDYYGNSFQIVPAQPDKQFGANGYLSASESLTVTTS
jgi:hypothetical protein